MHPARIAELLQLLLCSTPNPCHSEEGQRPGEEPTVLSPTQLDHISTYIDLLLRWNARINLTAIRTEEEIVTRHFGESLFAARQLFPPYPVSASVPPVSSVVTDVDLDLAKNHQPTAFVRPANRSVLGTRYSIRVADLGSGAGFPGIPIRLWAPNIALTLIESNHKKAAFLREVVRALTLTNIDIQNARAEDINQTFDVVTFRAVERFADTLPIAARLVAPAGRLALLISRPQLDNARSRLPQFAWQTPIPVPLSQSRLILVGKQEPSE